MYVVVPPTPVQTPKIVLASQIHVKCYGIQVSKESRAPVTASDTASPLMMRTEMCSFILFTSLSKFTAGKVPARSKGAAYASRAVFSTYIIAQDLGYILCNGGLWDILFQRIPCKQHCPKPLCEYASHSFPLKALVLTVVTEHH